MNPIFRCPGYQTVQYEHWPNERTEQLIELKARGLSHSQIARKLGVSRNAVSGRAYRIGLESEPRWTDERVELLKTLVARNLTFGQIALRMQMSRSAVKDKTRRLRAAERRAA